MKLQIADSLMLAIGITGIIIATGFTIQTYHGYKEYLIEYPRGYADTQHTGVAACINTAENYILCSIPPIIISAILGTVFIFAVIAEIANRRLYQ